MRRLRGKRRWITRIFVGGAGVVLTITMLSVFVWGRIAYGYRGLAIGHGEALILWPYEDYRPSFDAREFRLGFDKPRFSFAWPDTGDSGMIGVAGWKTRDHHIRIPLWMPCAVFAIPAAALWWADRRRMPAGHCRRCGYDLTGNVSGVCPECGAAVSRGAVRDGH